MCVCVCARGGGGGGGGEHFNFIRLLITSISRPLPPRSSLALSFSLFIDRFEMFWIFFSHIEFTHPLPE